MTGELYFDVALNVPLNKTFLYRHPDETTVLENEDFFGRRIDVRFGNRSMTGFIVGTHTSFPEDCGVAKEKVRRALKFTDKDNAALLTPELYDVATFMSRYYLSPIGETVSAMIPSGRRETSGGSFAFEEDESSFKKHQLSDEQKKAVSGILEGDTLYHYLYGMTGSGKTEVFLAAAEQVLALGKGVIYLVPEIALTPQVTEAVLKRFGNTAAVLHSALTPSQRLGEWKRILKQEARVVVGARSAVFAPLPHLGLIIIDEEHDSSYKAGSSPRYHARQVAMHRCVKNKCPLVMGSATPSLEAWHLMQTGAIKKHTLSRRLAGGALPKIQCVRLGQQGNDACISNQLESEIKETLKRKRQVILFLNRRGFTHFFRCQSCGFELTCKNCSVSLTYHKAEKRLRCHYCGYSVAPPSQCPSCGSLDVGYSGFGTEYIEAEVKARFPNARIVRIDPDSLTHKGELQEKLAAFKAGQYDILLGTQMVAKGLNFPSLQLVGVVMADTALHLPDFRAAERTFALITQVAGRAGRFFPDGKVIVQSYSPEREAIAYAVKGDTEGFYTKELENRKLLDFPPFVRLLRIVFRSPHENQVEVAAHASEVILRTHLQDGCEILGPADCPLKMVSGNYRKHILLKAKRIEPLQKMAKILTQDYENKLEDVHIEIDVDPQNLL